MRQKEGGGEEEDSSTSTPSFGERVRTPSFPMTTSNFAIISGVRPGALPLVTSSGVPVVCMYSSMLFPKAGTSICKTIEGYPYTGSVMVDKGRMVISSGEG